MYLTLAERIVGNGAPEFFEVPIAPEFLHPSLLDAPIGEAGYQQLQSMRVLYQAKRIADEMERRRTPIKQSTRGARREVICLTRLDPANPKRLMRYRSVTLAAASVGQLCDNISQAIRRQGTAGGHTFQFVVDLPVGFNERAIVRALRLKSPVKRRRAAKFAERARRYNRPHGRRRCPDLSRKKCRMKIQCRRRAKLAA